MVKIIADSGSSKTAWRIWDNEKITQEITLGLNPYYVSETHMRDELQNSFLKTFATTPVELYFYGSGCASESSKQTMQQVFRSILNEATIEINDDMLGAARATCGSEAGISCILGTGSNSCFYDGNTIAENIPSSGFILGDEGSGSYMGKRLLGDFIRGQLPQALHDKLEKRYELTRDEILEKVYHTERPNRYLAQFGKFLFQNRKDPYCSQLVMNSFDAFFLTYVVNYDRYLQLPVHFVGSIGFYFSDLLRKAARKHEIRIGKILEDPAAGLVLFHQEKLV